MFPLVAQAIILFAIAIASLTLVAAALAQFLAVVLADLLCKPGHVFLHGFHACHE